MLICSNQSEYLEIISSISFFHCTFHCWWEMCPNEEKRRSNRSSRASFIDLCLSLWRDHRRIVFQRTRNSFLISFTPVRHVCTPISISWTPFHWSISCIYRGTSARESQEKRIIELSHLCSNKQAKKLSLFDRDRTWIALGWHASEWFVQFLRFRFDRSLTFTQESPCQTCHDDWMNQYLKKRNHLKHTMNKVNMISMRSNPLFSSFILNGLRRRKEEEGEGEKRRFFLFSSLNRWYVG